MIDFYASEPHFLDHLVPVWNALPPDVRGSFVTSRPLYEHAGKRELTAGEEPDPEHPVVVAAWGDVQRALRIGYTRLVRLEHGIGQSYLGNVYGSYAGGPGHEPVGLFLMPNEYSAAHWRAAYPEASMAVVGSPHLDALPARKPGRQTIALSFHWACYLVPETIGAHSHYRDVFEELAARFNLIAHGHPRALAARLGKLYRRANLEVVPDFHEVCERADLYACDNSSSLYEFAATGRPVVVLNAPWFRRDVHHGLRFWEAADVGLQVDQAGELGDAIDRALTDPRELREKREAALNIVYAHRSGAARRAADAILSWAGIHRAVAA